MLNLEEILAGWKKDSVIDEMNLDEASRETVKLHSKYLELFSVMKLQLKRKEMAQQILLRDKWLYYTGKMDQAEITKRGWAPDPFNGLKIMKSDMQYYYNADPELQKQDEQIEYFKTMVSALEEIMTNIKWRHTTIKNMIDWRRFTSGG
jgi:hypothetical protein